MELHDQTVALRPDWHSDDDYAGLVRSEMAGSASDPEASQTPIGGKARRDLLAKRAKDPKNPWKLVIVRDIWLTGIDSPSMHTMNIEKPMCDHGLMHAIGPVNRVCRDKPAGLIVDHIGIAQNLKSALGQYSTKSDRDLGIRQTVNGAVASTRIVDMPTAAGLSSPDISILSDEFLAEVSHMEKKNFAREALKKSLNDEIRSRSKSSVIETRKFSERLEEAISRYHANAVSMVEVLQELIALAKDVGAARSRGKETGLTPDEVALYDAHSDNQSAVEVLGNEKPRLIA